MKTITYILPAYWASYLINGDDSGIEDRAEVDAFLAREGLPMPVSCSDESWFSWHNDATELGGDVMEFVFLVADKPAPAPMTQLEIDSLKSWAKCRENSNYKNIPGY